MMYEAFEFLLSLLRFAAPLMLAAMGGMMCERSGVINIALEGLMLFGAFTAAAVASLSGNPWLGLMAGAAAGLIVGLFYAWLVIGLRSDQIVAGTGVNMLAAGGIPFIGKILFDATATTPPLAVDDRLPSWLPIVLALLFAFLLHGMVTRSRFGLWLTFAGEKPEALRAVGIRPARVRLVAVACGGLLAGLGGAVLSIALASSYTRGMSAGRGFMALAALILGKWRPLPAAAACLLFGFCEVLQLKLQGVVWPVVGEIPVQLVQVIPYLLTLLLVAGVVGESRAPAALGT